MSDELDVYWTFVLLSYKAYSLPFLFFSVDRLARGWRSSEAAPHYQTITFGKLIYIYIYIC
ncbi:hypothetical protein F383_28996 [Gossypium arboreum]|uniref:Uncharacterized protein n=1 Tax=Gossypium arboreum TaxID=29729 RepID=A0A0B0PI97_GOSAR|nr:hypothetical protein F383_28996 [Gossypium arboreum]